MSSEQLGLSLMDHVAPAIAVLAMAAVLALLLKRRTGLTGFLPARQGKNHGERLRLIDRVNLSPQSSICILERGDRRWLVSSSPSGVSLLESLGPADVGSAFEAASEPQAAAESPKADPVQEALARFDRIRRTATSVRMPAPPPRAALTAAAYLE